MKRDMDLVRKILLSMEDSEHGYIDGNPIFEGYTEEQVSYHVYLMAQAGLIHAADISSMSSESPEALATALTWNGHEFLEASRKPEIWSQAKELIAKSGGASFEIWKAVLTELIKSNLGL